MQEVTGSIPVFSTGKFARSCYKASRFFLCTFRKLLGKAQNSELCIAALTLNICRMKFTKLELKDFNQFKGLAIDLTYPTGHEKAGQPLEKVCFIGQSGTGKTTLLKLMKGVQFSLNELIEEYGEEKLSDHVFYEFLIGELAGSATLTYPDKNKEKGKFNRSWYSDSLFLNESSVTFEDALEYGNKIRESINTETVYLPSEISFSETSFTPSGKPIGKSQKHFDFGKINIADTWSKVLSEIQEHQEKELVVRQSISKLVEEGAGPTEIAKALEPLTELKKKEFNPLKRIAEECLNPILNHFNLRVKTEFDFQKKDDIGFIKIEDFQGNEIPNGLLSTGTKQIILSALPLYLLKPNQTVILYDEPERSLYPSIQRVIVDFYTSLTTDSQFFFATHSPIIASCFEPWEIVELKFNKEGHVYQELYYPKEKERHVDNYTIVPAYLTYELMLREVFDVKETSSAERSEKITEVLMLRDELQKCKEEGKSNTPKAKKLFKQYTDLAAKLFWEFDTV